MIEKEQYDVAMLDTEYSIVYGHNILKTPSGNLVSHRNLRLIQHIVRQLSLNDVSENNFNVFSIFSFFQDNNHNINNYFEKNINSLVKNDLLINIRNLKTNNALPIDALINEFDKNQNILNLVFMGTSIAFKALNEYLIENDISLANYDIDTTEKISSLIAKLIDNLQQEQKACILLLNLRHKSGILLPSLLINEKISVMEYANALYSIHFYSSFLKELSELSVELTENDSTYVLKTLDWENTDEFFKIARIEATQVEDYIFYLKENVNPNSSLTQLIKQGESTYLEFKSTLRWNIRAAKKDAAIEHASLKTIAAFLNSSGGTLLIGVRDDGSIEGIETDSFTDNDKFLLHFWNLIKSSLGQEFCPFVDTKIESFAEKNVCIVRCQPSNRPAFLKQTGFEEEFFIRTGPSSSKLGISEALKYISDRFDIKAS